MLDKKVSITFRGIIIMLLTVLSASLILGFFIGRDNNYTGSLTNCVATGEAVGYLKQLPHGTYYSKAGEKILVHEGLYYTDPSAQKIPSQGYDCNPDKEFLKSFSLMKEDKIWDSKGNKYLIFRAWVGKDYYAEEGSDLAMMPNP